MNQSLSKTTKPILAIQTLVNALQPYAMNKVSPPQRKFSHFGKQGNICYLILEGYIQLHRTQDGMVLSSIKAPMILGLSNNLIPGAEDFFFTTKTLTTFSVVSTHDAMEVIKQQKLWESVSVFQAYLIRHLNELNAKLVAIPAYEMTRNQLINLMSEPDEFRRSVTASEYIQDHTKLSRSGIMRMLSQLKKGGYIRLNKGCLIEINNIPLRF